MPPWRYSSPRRAAATASSWEGLRRPIRPPLPLPPSSQNPRLFPHRRPSVAPRSRRTSRWRRVTVSQSSRATGRSSLFAPTEPTGSLSARATRGPPALSQPGRPTATAWPGSPPSPALARPPAGRPGPTEVAGPISRSRVDRSLWPGPPTAPAWPWSSRALRRSNWGCWGSTRRGRTRSSTATLPCSSRGRPMPTLCWFTGAR